MDYPKPSKDMRAAMVATMSLNHWGAVVDLLEGSAGNHCNNAAKQRVIKIAKAEMQRDLKRMDAAVGKVNAASSRT